MRCIGSKNRKQQFKRLGVRGDWNNPYMTLDPAYEAQQIRIFGDMVKKGYIYKGLKADLLVAVFGERPGGSRNRIQGENVRLPSTSPFDVKDGKGVLPRRCQR